MKRIITLIGLTLGLSGGVAAADSRIHHGPIIERGHGPVVRDNHRVAYRSERFTDYRYRPAARFERIEFRSGYHWVAGEWIWTGCEWTWINGHYAR
ncbi:MAG TPA: hypothetical protein VGO00_27565 [Kofleriaceae bacterium]|jgi:hypothetical protein|nr:hypothetical protein [Kofleriaceae bacterium]